MSINVAIIGASGIVGSTMLEMLEQSSLDIRQLSLLASDTSAGSSKLYKGHPIDLENLNSFNFADVDLALFAVSDELALEYAPQAIAAGCMVIDNSSAFRLNDDVPLVVPEVNAQVLQQVTQPTIIANPNCTAIQLCVALQPIQTIAKILTVNIATYQAVSGAGQAAMSELIEQTAGLLNGKHLPSKVFQEQIAFNAIPQIGDLGDDGYTNEERKIFHESKKILGDNDLVVNAMAVRIPTIFGHGIAASITTDTTVDLEILKKVYHTAPGIELIDPYPSAMGHAVGKNSVYIGRLRQAQHLDNTIDCWIVADNVRKGAAWNAIQIAERLFK